MATINLYITADENNKLNKTLTDLTPFNGAFRDNVNIMSPVFNIETGLDISLYNYAYIPEFHRYYFIKNITAVRTGLWQLELNIDVLMSYSSGIQALSAVIRRNTNLYNTYINDNNYMSLNYPRIQTKLFPNGFGIWNYILTTTGKAGSTTVGGV